MKRLATLTLLLSALFCLPVRADEAEARKLFDRAIKAIQSKDFKTAADLLRQAVKLQPGNDTYLGNLGYVEGVLGNARAALDHSEKAIALNPRVHWYHANAALYAHRLADFAKTKQFARKALTFDKAQLGAETAKALTELLDDLRPRTYTVRWKLTPSKGWGEGGQGKGPFYVPLASTGLPYQTAKYTVRGAKTHKAVTRDGIALLRFEADGNRPVEITTTVTVRLHDYRQLIKAKATGEWRCPDAVKSFLGAGSRVDPKEKQVVALAAKLKAKTPAATVDNLLGWLKANLTYKQVGPNEASAAQVIERGYGDCGCHSAVFVAVCRSAGIPAREVWGPTKTTQFAPPGHMGGHVWAEVYLTGVGWVPVEPQNQNGLGHMPLGYVRMLYNPPTALRWPNAMRSAWGAMFHMGSYTPKYEEKLLPESEK